ncbi:MAG: diguanylate cyclase [Oxalobacteraceae bacterium]|nr:MAG: diguanylate cyclase [Oxalobacteraceae bacterium]
MTHAHGAAAARDDPGVYRTLLESTKAIPWRIDWSTARFTYIGPQIEGVLGWRQDSWQTVNDWADRIHPKDRQRTVDFCIAQSINERKRAEDKILQLQKELEALSYRDALTGIANRRMFDSMLDVEWAKARVAGEPLALVIVDIDFFKQYNDRYGHPRGDACLQAVARVLDRGAARTRDLCARLGGEEFALLLPATDEAAALGVAERCARLLARAALPHEASAVAAVVTCSMGIATLVPGAHDEPARLIDLADTRLYQAKRTGRNRVVAGKA